MRTRTRQIQEKRGQSRKREQFRVDEVMGENLERFPTPGPMAPNVPGLGRPQGKEGSVRPEELSLVRPWVVESGPCPLSGDTCQPDCPGIVWEAEEPKLASDEAQPAFQAALPPHTLPHTTRAITSVAASPLSASSTHPISSPSIDPGPGFQELSSERKQSCGLRRPEQKEQGTKSNHPPIFCHNLASPLKPVA